MSDPYTGGGSGTTSSRAQFNISYGTGSQLSFTTHAASGSTPKYFNTTGSKISYASGSPDGRSVRLDCYPDGGKWNDKTNYSWQSNPGYLYTSKGIGNSEFTTYIRPQGDLGTHQAYAHKINGRDEDSIRSLVEICAADQEHSKPFFHWNYAHSPYVAGTVTIVGPFTKMQAGKWLGLKSVHKIATDKQSSKLELWEDPNPFNSSGQPANNWRLTATITEKGCSDYGNVPCTWKCQKEVCRIDGFSSVDFTLISVREIDINSKPSASDTFVPDYSTLNDPDPVIDEPLEPEDNLDGTLDLLD